MSSPDGLAVLVHTEPTKIGRTIGFCDMTVSTVDGVVLARGQHIKFLQMGLLWDIFMHPILMPVTVHVVTLLNSFLKSRGKKEVKQVFVDDSVGGLYRGLRLRSEDTNPNRFSMSVQSLLHNPLGALHGGALAMACEEAALQSVPKGLIKFLSRMEVTYINSMKNSIHVLPHNFMRYLFIQVYHN